MRWWVCLFPMVLWEFVAGISGVYRESSFESALSGAWESATLDGVKADESSMASDIHAAADYRAHLVGEMARRAVAAST